MSRRDIPTEASDHTPIASPTACIDRPYRALRGLKWLLQADRRALHANRRSLHAYRCALCGIDARCMDFAFLERDLAATKPSVGTISAFPALFTHPQTDPRTPLQRGCGRGASVLEPDSLRSRWGGEKWSLASDGAPAHRRPFVLAPDFPLSAFGSSFVP